MDKLNKILEDKVRKAEKFTNPLEGIDSEIEEKRKREEERRIEEESNYKRSILESIFNNFFYYGFIGALVGVVIGFGKGCADYDVGTSSFMEPFIYIPGGVYSGALIGCLFGIIFGYFKGVNKL